MTQSARSKNIGHSIVVINDDPGQLDWLCACFQFAGYNLLAFSSAEAFLAQAQPESPPSAIVTDLTMPEIDGWRLCRLLRSPMYEAFNQTPILVTSSTFSGHEPLQLTLQLGANAFLALPVSEQVVADTLEALLKGESPHSLLTILIIDPNENETARLMLSFEIQGYQGFQAFNLRTAMKLAEQTSFDVAVVNAGVLEENDALLAQLVKKSPNGVFVIMAGSLSAENAANWMKKGAAFCVQTPCDPNQLVAQCDRARREHSLLRVQVLAEQRSRQLRESRAYLRMVIDSTRDGFFSLDCAGRLLDANRAYCAMTGYSLQELRELSIYDLDSCSDPGVITARMDRVTISGAETFDTCHRRKDGSTFDLEVSVAYQIEEGGSFICFGRDIGERKRAKDALSHSHSLMRYILEYIRGGVAVFDRDMKYIYVSQRYLDEYRLGNTQVIGRSHYEIMPEIPQTWRDIHQAALAGRVLSSDDDIFVRANGKTDWTRWECRPWYESDGSIGGMILYSEVITERKQFENALRQSEEKYRLIVENQQDLLVKMDAYGHCLYANPLYCDLFGKTEAELIGTFFPPLVTRFSLLSNAPYESAFEERVETRRGWRWLSWKLKAVLDELGAVTGLIGSGRDDTERIEAEIKNSEQLDELRRWHNITLGREDRILELKREVNALRVEAGKQPLYASAMETAMDLYPPTLKSTPDR